MAANELTLTDDQMSLIGAAIELAEFPGVDAVLETFKALMGVEAWEAAEQVKPSDWAIPEAQWSAICDEIVKADRVVAESLDPEEHQVNTSMVWMNKGPSGW